MTFNEKADALRSAHYDGPNKAAKLRVVRRAFVRRRGDIDDDAVVYATSQ